MSLLVQKYGGTSVGSVERIEAVADRVAAGGGAVYVPPTEIPVGTFSVLRDPQGATFSVITLSAPA